MRLAAPLALAAALALLVPSRSLAQTCLEPPSTDQEASARLEWLRAMTMEQDGAAERWRWGWLGFHTALGTTLGVIGLSSDDRNQRRGAAVGVVGSVLGIGTMLLPFYLSDGLDVEVAEPIDSTPHTRRLALRRVERLVEQAADADRFRTGWLAHAGTIAWAIGSSAYLFAAANGEQGWRNLLGALVISQTRIWTLPTTIRDGWDLYAARHGCAATPTERTRVSVVAVAGGAGVAISF